MEGMMGDSEKLKITYCNTMELIPDPDNARAHDRRNIDAIKGSIQKFGIRKPVVAHESSKIIYAGNGVYTAAVELGLAEIPVAWIPQEIPVEVAKAFAIYDNRTNELSDWDPEKLETLLDELEDFNLDELLWSPVELNELLDSIENDDEDRTENFDADEAMAEESEPITQTGNIWLCGKHRVMCGDSMEKGDVERLMAGDMADLLLTDPPYGVSYASKNRHLNQFDKGYRIEEPIEGDSQPLDELGAMWKIVCENAYLFTSEKASYYWFACQGGMQMMMMSINDAKWAVKQELIWVKNNHVLGRSDYQYKHEPILYGWKQDGTHNFYGGFQTSVLTFDKGLNNDLHPIMKPVGLISLLIKNSSIQDNLILDPFLGSGTTLIAAEKTNRICYGMEISCAYCDVICRRYYELTNDIPILESTGEPFPINA
jgi:site-specific DNA-methyltransferase (adenine-specific)